MDNMEIDIAFAYANKKKKIRLNKNQFYRRKVRQRLHHHLHPNESFDAESSLIKKFAPIKLTNSNENNLHEADVQSFLKSNISRNNQIEENDDDLVSCSDTSGVFDSFDHQETNDLNLHHYALIGCISFSKNLIDFIRKANISKSHTERLISLIRSALPQPNNLPKNYADLLSLLAVENIFNKRVVCVNCKIDVSTTTNKCLKCTNGSRERLAFIFDTFQETVFNRVYNRLFPIINSYRESFQQQQTENDTNDIIYNNNYKVLRGSTNNPFISLLLHIDGINLGKSTKQKLWLFSCSILELPPIYRNRRHNNIILSTWIGNEQPDIHLWLNHCIGQLMILKSSGFPTRGGGRMVIKVYGIIADCPAMSSILNHIQHSSYHCCWYCKIKGEHINILNKRQYYYNEGLQIRDRLDFEYDSRLAQRLQTNINGRLGTSILDKIMDIPLLKCIIADYLHVTLLRHAKTILIYTYTKIMKNKEHSVLDQRILKQRFPHFFQRAIRPLSDTYLKASELRNLLLYCILPMVRNVLECQRAAHLGLFVAGIRLIHGSRIFREKTVDQAHELLTTFYRDHETFYNGQQNYALHLHYHFYELYQNHGSLSNINTFSQEDIIGSISEYKHGSRHWSDQLAFYLNIDFALINMKRADESASSTSISAGVFDETAMPVELNQIIINIHSKLCHCVSMNTCIKFYRRLRNKKQIVYHSLSYAKRQSAVSYFVKYGTSFGSILTFMHCNMKQYAIIKHYPTQKLFSDNFITSTYYELLCKSIDELFFVLNKVSTRLDIVNVDDSFEMCILIEEDECFIASPISAYHEHD